MWTKNNIPRQDSKILPTIFTVYGVNTPVASVQEILSVKQFQFIATPALMPSAVTALECM
jgi:hypothetical protein